MVKTKLEIEQIVAKALLLNLDNISSLDITLLAEEFLANNPRYEFTDLNITRLKQYVNFENNRISLKEGLSLDTYIEEKECDLKRILYKYSGLIINKYFDKFNIERHILKKIRYYSTIPEEMISTIFCKKEQQELQEMIDKGYIDTAWNNDIIYNAYKEIKLSIQGNLRLFKVTYKRELDRFTKELMSLRYDISILEDFLKTQDLELPVWDVLNIEKIDKFCNDFDRVNLESGVSRVYYERLTNKKGKNFDRNNDKIMNEALTLWDRKHAIYICHPNYIFKGEPLLSKDVKDIKNINWNDIDIEKMFRSNDYKSFILSSCNQAINYVYNGLDNQIIREIKNGERDTAISHLVVIEKYHYNYEDYYIVRCIIRGDTEEYSIAFNPEYKKTIPQNEKEKIQRINGQGTPNIYCLKRKK